jgi:energy-coupling factor transport system permease protein
MNQSEPILLGQYRPIDSYLHRLDARAKLLPILVVLILSLLTSSMLFYGIILLTLIGSLLASGVQPISLWRNFRPMFVLIAITALYHLIFSGHNTPVVAKIGFIVIHAGALQAAGFYSLRLILFVSTAFLVTLTNSPSELAEAVTALIRPLRHFGVPVNDLGLIIFTAIRFIPILYDEFNAIRNAQIMRGVSFSGTLVARVRKSSSLLIPVFVAAIGRADDLAIAIESRGYDGRRERTVYSTTSFGPGAWTFMVVTSVAIGLLFVVTRVAVR